MTTLPPDPNVVPRWDPPPLSPPPSVGAPAAFPPPEPLPGTGVSAVPHRRGRALFWTALGLLIAGALLLLGAFGGLMANVDDVDTRPGVAVPGARSVTLEAGHRYTVYVVRPSGSTRVDPRVTLTAPDGTEERMVEPFGAITEEGDDGVSTPYGDVTVALTGTYELRTEAVDGLTDGTRVTLGRGVDQGEENVGLGLFMLGSVLTIAGLGVGAAWLLVRRRPAAVRAGR